MTVAILVMVLTQQKISLNQRSIMQNSKSAPQIGGIVRMTKFIALGHGDRAARGFFFCTLLSYRNLAGQRFFVRFSILSRFSVMRDLI